ncbi:hypothetical protein AB0I28_36565 [Phytomonospora sp. NPDC050363]|uniref:hypothetical protein n=1 Tax=Phytomonospora sp. NPDC050363 TaxID=3155642 RepID=UPI00340FB5FB
MSAAVPFGPPPPQRPRGVFAAAYLLAGSGAFWLAAAIATLFAIPQYERHHSDLAQDPSAGVGVTLLLILFATGAFAAAGTAVLLAVFDAKGRPAARVMTWILGGLAVGVALALLLLDPFTATAWHRGLMIGASVLTLVSTSVVIVLLGSRSSGGYFRGVRWARMAAARAAYAARYRPVPQYPQAPPGWTVHNPPPAPPVNLPQPFAPRPPGPPHRPPSGPPPTESGWGRPG